MPGDHRVRAAHKQRSRRIIAGVRSAYRQSTRAFAALICGLGVVMVVSTLVRGGGPLAIGVIVGAAFVVLGAGRLYLAGER